MKPKPPKMYVFVRNDLDVKYRMVQGGHAISEHYEQHGHHDNWKNDTLVYLGVRGERQLKDWIWKLQHKYRKNFVYWCEPDLGNQVTSIACIDTGEIFSKLSLA